MELLFLGTGAADWDITKPSRDRNFRRFASLLCNRDLLIDPGPCIYEFAETFGCPELYNEVAFILVTHRHADHYCEATLDRLGRDKLIAFDGPGCKQVGGYTVTALAANHATAEAPLHYLIADAEGKCFFYGCDGAWLLFPEYQAIMEQRPDLVILDGTIGDADGDYRIFEHNNLRMVEEMQKTLAPYCSRFMITHMARTLHTSHEQLEERLRGSGIVPAYDHMCVRI